MARSHRLAVAAFALLLTAAWLAAQTAPSASTRPAHGDHPAATYPEGVPAPIITDKFAADPHAIVIGDTYYVYPTVDKENWATTEFMCWSSKDLVHWKDEGVILDLAGQATGHADVSWARIRAWAPGVAARDGKVYFYFCGEQSIGVAVADKPTGPFKDALGKPLVARGAYSGQMIDPCPFIDDDGQAYLYFGNGSLYVAKLNKDMISLDGRAQTITPRFQGGRFNEGIFVTKRKGTYYYMWSENDARADNYQVAYGTSNSPTGPIQVAQTRIVLHNDGKTPPLVKGTGHHSVINVPGTDDWYMFYHRHAVPGGNGFIREVCLGKMEFAPDPAGGPDLIKPVDVVHPAFPEGSPGQPVPALK